MTTPTTADLLKYADLQMAAEAFLVNAAGDLVDLKTALVRGNDRASKFTTTQADNFVAHWEVVAQQANTATGFSGTLFRSKDTGELVISMRSTEFLDDNARDNMATNTMELKEFGWAFGQIADMEQWYAELRVANPTQPFAVTGYSLGGSLASAFAKLRIEDGTYASHVSGVYTFNGAGVGDIVGNGGLQGALNIFNAVKSVRATDPTATPSQFTTVIGKTTYDFLYKELDLKDGEPLTVGKLGDLQAYLAVKISTIANGDFAASADLDLLAQALARSRTVLAENVRVAGLKDSKNNPVVAPGNTIKDIAALGLNYQLGILTAQKQTASYNAGFVDGAQQGVPEGQAGGFGRGRSIKPGMPANIYDIHGSSFRPDDYSAVSNSQWHYGNDTPVFIEDQPLRRGNYVWTSVAASFRYWGIKLIDDNFDKNDFGDSHSLVLVVDSLSVQATLERLDTALKPETIVSLCQAATNLDGDVDLSFGTDQGHAEGDLLENMVNWLGTMLGFKPSNTAAKDDWEELKGNPNGGTWAETVDKDGYTGRSTLHKNLELLAGDAGYKALLGKATITLANSNLATTAKNDFAAFLSLNALSPVVISTTDATAIAALKTANADVATAWKNDKDARLDPSKALAYSDQWYTDRTAMLGTLMQRNQINTKNAVGYSNIDYLDVPGNTKILQRINGAGVNAPANKITFGGDSDEQLNGTDNAQGDHLYGGEGNDTLNGKAGSDYLEGNSGADTYIIGEGIDRVRDDADGEGKLQTKTGYIFSGGTLRYVNGWESADKQSLYVRQGADLAVFKTGDTVNYTLIQNFDFDKAQNNVPYLGILLRNPADQDPSDPKLPSPPIPVPVNTAFNSGVNWRRAGDPLVLDLDGDGVELTTNSSGVLFDHNDDTIQTGTQWAKADDALLVRDLDGNGLIETGRELFGDQTLLPSGQLAPNGFAALSALDSNGDGVFNTQDAAYGELKLWRDINQDGVSQTAELQTLAQAGVSSIALSPNGQGKYTFTKTVTTVATDGTTSTSTTNPVVQSVNFGTNSFYRNFTDNPVITSAAQALPQMQGSGLVRDLREAMSLNTAQAATLVDKVTAFKAAQTTLERQTLLADLVAAWGATSSQGDAVARNPVQGDRSAGYAATPAQAIEPRNSSSLPAIAV